MMILRRLDPVSVARILGLLYACIGFIVGAFVSFFAAIGVLGHAFSRGAGLGMIEGAFLGAGAILLLPILYGVLGAMVGVIGAAIYNLIAGKVGGIELELTPKA
jgi:hypothetical protein